MELWYNGYYTALSRQKQEFNSPQFRQKKYNSQHYPHIWENLSKREDRGSIPPVRLDCQWSIPNGSIWNVSSIDLQAGSIPAMRCKNMGKNVSALFPLHIVAREFLGRGLGWELRRCTLCGALFVGQIPAFPAKHGFKEIQKFHRAFQNSSERRHNLY